MLYIAHRVNTIEELRRLPTKYGVELDLRDGLDGRIYISHDPFTPGEDFEEYLNEYKHGMMILNIKSERIEEMALDLIQKYGIQNYFFLDSSFPMIKLLTDKGVCDVALRYSEYEGVDTIENMAGKAKWVWVDTFTQIPIDKPCADRLHSLGYRLCLVSPELQGRPECVDSYVEECISKGLAFDAVCSKLRFMPAWEKAFAK